MTAHRPVHRHWLQAKRKCNEGCNSCASLAGLVVSFIVCFSLLVIAPLRQSSTKLYATLGSHALFMKSRKIEVFIFFQVLKSHDSRCWYVKNSWNKVVKQVGPVIARMLFMSEQWCSTNSHRRRSSVNFGGTHFCPKICVWKINKMPEFHNFTWYLADKFFPDFFFLGGGHYPLPFVSYAYANNIGHVGAVNIHRRSSLSVEKWAHLHRAASMADNMYATLHCMSLVFFYWLCICIHSFSS